MRSTIAAKGLTMVELLIVVIIIGVLAGFAIPAYQNYTIRSNRSDGYVLVNEILQAQERFFSDQLTYTTDLTDLGYATAANLDTDAGYYKVSGAACAGGTIAQCVVVTGVAQNNQSSDGDMSINSRGAKIGNW